MKTLLLTISLLSSFSLLGESKVSKSNCSAIDEKRYPKEKELCEKMEEAVNKSNCSAIDEKRYPKEKELCEKMEDYSEDLSTICSSDKGDGRVVCNGKTYKLDTSYVRREAGS